MGFRRALLLSAAAFAAACLAPLTVLGSADGAPPAHTGGYGEATCQQCHWENPLNAPGGELRLDGIPDTYTAGEQYLITVTLTRQGLEGGGFQISAREDGREAGAAGNAGMLEPADDRTSTIDGAQEPVTYLQQTLRGSEVTASGIATWTFRWTAPQDGPVVFHAAANAANGDDSPLGDFIYTAEARSMPGGK